MRHFMANHHRSAGLTCRLTAPVAAAFLLASPVHGQMADLARPTIPMASQHPQQLSPISKVSLAAMNAELAWWTDPTLLPCDIQIVPRGRGLEVRGFVPSEAVRDRA